MTSLLQPDPNGSHLVRTSFGSEGDWETFVDQASDAYGPDDFAAYFVAISDLRYEGRRPEELPAATTADARAIRRRRRVDAGPGKDDHRGLL